MLSCTISNHHWTHFALMCAHGRWTEGNGIRKGKATLVRDGNLLSNFTCRMAVWMYRRQRWPDFIRWLASSFNIRAHFELQHAKFKQLTQNPGEAVHVYIVLWNLERDLVEELAVAEVYPAGSVHEEEFENMYIRSLVISVSSKLYDLRAIGGTLNQVMHGGVRDTVSDGSSKLSLGLQLLQKHAVKLDNDQLIASELRKLHSPRALARTFPRQSFPFSSQRHTTHI